MSSDATADGEVGAEPAPPPSPSRWRRWWRGGSLRRVALGMAWGVGLASLVPLWVVYPYWRDDRALDLVVRVVALDWRDFGERAARARLQYELDHQRIGMWVTDRSCTLTDGPIREVRCGWSVDLAVPGTHLVVPLAFSSRAELLPDGDVR